MLTQENTIEYALGFILGESFGRIIQSIVTELVTPVFNVARVLLRGSDIVVHTGSGWLCVEEADRDNSTAPLSAEAAALTGCEVINYKAFYEAMLPGSGKPFLVYQLTGGPFEHDCYTA